MRCTFLAVAALVLGAASAPAFAVIAPQTWTIGQAPLPADAASAESATADAVDCASAAFCAVVGSYWAAATDEAVAYLATLRDSAWTSVRAPLPAGADSSPYLDGVTCSAPGSCVAVGGFGAGAGQPLIETLADGTWTAQTLSGTQGALDRVACGATQCVATGETDPTTVSAPLIVDRGTGAWRARSVSTPATHPATPPTVSGVACPVSGNCYAVGANDQGALQYHRVGGTWIGHYLPMPRGISSGGSSGDVSCAATGNCVALVPGTESSSGTPVVVAVQLHDSRWLPTTIAPRPRAAGTLSAVALDCPAVDACGGSATVTLGGGHTRGILVALSEGAWTAVAAPAPADALGTPDTALSDVGCQSAGACTAVGGYMTNVDGRSVRRPLVETASGGMWTPTGLSVPSGVAGTESAALTAVSCVAPRCVATGWYHGRAGSPLPKGGIVAVANHVRA